MKTLKKLFVLAFLIFTISSPAIGYAVSYISVQNGTLILTTAKTVPVIFYDGFDGDKLSDKWLVEQMDNTIAAYIPFSPPDDTYTVRVRVKSSQLSHFKLSLSVLEPPLAGVPCFQIEMNEGATTNLGKIPGDNWGYCFAATWHTRFEGITPTSFYGPAALDTWYILEVVAEDNPYQFTFNVYSDAGKLLGTCITGTVMDRGAEVPNISAFQYSNVKNIVLESTGSQSTYSVDWIKIIG